MNIFQEHPDHAGETYFQHLLFAAKLSAVFMLASFVSLIHAVFPFILTDNTGKLAHWLASELQAKDLAIVKDTGAKDEHGDVSNSPPA